MASHHTGNACRKLYIASSVVLLDINTSSEHKSPTALAYRVLRFSSPPIHPETKSIVASVTTLVDSLTQKTATLYQTRVATMSRGPPDVATENLRLGIGPGRLTASDFSVYCPLRVR